MSATFKEAQPILFVLTIDTEEEWDWQNGFPQQDCQVTNIAKLADFQIFCQQLGIRPSYFVDYPVADSDQACEILRKPLEQGHCEIGAHLHPWCNPPYYGDVGEFESHVLNLPEEQVEAKLIALTERLKQQFSIIPRAFRSGRWGIDGKGLKLLRKHGYQIDSSVYPYYKNEYFSCYGSPLLPYWADINSPLMPVNQSQGICEIPVTVSYNRQNFERADRIHRALSHPALNWLRPVGLAWHTHLLRKLYLCPELSKASDMLTLCHNAVARGAPILHMYMHSSCLIDNNNSLLGNENAYQYMTSEIEKVVSELKQTYQLEFCSISEAAQRLGYGETPNAN